MTAFVYDGAYAPNLDAVVAHGGVAMSVYLTGRYASTCASPRQLFTKGLGVFGNYEEGAGELLTAGYAGGVDIGRRAAAAYAKLGCPTGKGYGLAFSVDVNAAPSTFPAIARAFDGVDTGVAGAYAVKIYGEGALIDYLVAHGEVTGKQWLSASTSFPGFNAASPNVGMVQLVGTPVAGTDQDRVTDLAGLGIWWPPGSPYTTFGDTSMPITNADADLIAKHVWALERDAGNGLKGSMAAFLEGADSRAVQTVAGVAAVTKMLSGPGGLVARVAALQAATAALEQALTDVAASVKAGQVSAGTLSVSGTLSVGGAA